MFPRETVSFVFQRVLMFPSTSSRETSGLEEKKLTSFPRDHTSSALLHNYLDFPLNNYGENHALVFGVVVGNNCAIVSWSG